MPDFLTNSSAIISLLIGAGALLWIYNQAMVAAGKRRAEQPFIISMEKKFVSQDEHQKHADYVEAKLVTAARRRKDIHELQEQHSSRLARLEEQNKSQTDSLNLLSSDFRTFTAEQRGVNSQILNKLTK